MRVLPNLEALFNSAVRGGASWIPTPNCQHTYCQSPPVSAKNVDLHQIIVGILEGYPCLGTDFLHI